MSGFLHCRHRETYQCDACRKLMSRAARVARRLQEQTGDVNFRLPEDVACEWCGVQPWTVIEPWRSDINERGRWVNVDGKLCQTCRDALAPALEGVTL